MSEKLTKAQLSLLRLAGRGEIDTTWGHPEVASLAARGLLSVRHCVPGSAFVGGQTAKITEAGRAALENQP